MLGSCRIGCSLADLLDDMGRTNVHTKSAKDLAVDAAEFMQTFRHDEYILWFDAISGRASIVLKDGAASTSQLKAWCHALLVARAVQQQGSAPTSGTNGASTLALLRKTLDDLNEVFDMYIRRLQEAGWNTDTVALETKPGRRLTFSGKTNTTTLTTQHLIG